MLSILDGSPQHDRIARLGLPNRADATGVSARQADIDLISKAPHPYLDTTHFDTVRFPPPPWAIAAFKSAALDGSLAYTGYRGNADVLAVVADTVSGFLGIQVEPNAHLILTPGTQGGLFAALASLVENGSKVALLDPDYLFSERILGFLGAEVLNVVLRLDDGEPSPDLEALEDVFRAGARVFVFSHPHNPTGAVFSKSVIRQIATLAQRYDVTVVVDELYARLIYDGPFCHLASEQGMFERTVTLLGPSKTESLSGYRLGVVVAPKNIIARIEDVLSITALRAPAYAQHVLVPWLRADHDWLAERLDSFRTLRNLTERQLRRLPWLRLKMQRGTAYAWPDVSALAIPGPDLAAALLQEAQILVSPGYQFGPLSEGHFRICYARDEAEWISALHRIVDVLDKFAKARCLPSADVA